MIVVPVAGGASAELGNIRAHVAVESAQVARNCSKVPILHRRA
jgi:hypothetical protein